MGFMELLRTIDDGSINHLPLPRAFSLQQRSENAHRQEHRAATEITHQIQRWNRLTLRRTDGCQRPGQGDIVDGPPISARQADAAAVAQTPTLPTAPRRSGRNG